MILIISFLTVFIKSQKKNGLISVPDFCTTSSNSGGLIPENRSLYYVRGHRKLRHSTVTSASNVGFPDLKGTFPVNLFCHAPVLSYRIFPYRTLLKSVSFPLKSFPCHCSSTGLFRQQSCQAPLQVLPVRIVSPWVRGYSSLIQLLS